MKEIIVMKLTRFLLVLIGIIISTNLFAPHKTNDFRSEYLEVMKQRKREHKAEQMDMFLNALAFRESGGKYHVYNSFGYIGKYQFGYSARKSTGYPDIHFNDFVRNPDIWPEHEQDSAMIRLLEKNEAHLGFLIKSIELDAFVIHGKRITKSGILAGAHLGGYGNVLKYFISGYNAKDKFGTSVEDYIVEFSGYEI